MAETDNKDNKDMICSSTNIQSFSVSYTSDIVWVETYMSLFAMD